MCLAGAAMYHAFSYFDPRAQENSFVSAGLNVSEYIGANFMIRFVLCPALP